MHAAANEPKQLLIVDSSLHSSQLVGAYETEAIERTKAATIGFLEANS